MSQHEQLPFEIFTEPVTAEEVEVASVTPDPAHLSAAHIARHARGYDESTPDATDKYLVDTGTSGRVESLPVAPKQKVTKKRTSGGHPGPNYSDSGRIEADADLAPPLSELNTPEEALKQAALAKKYRPEVQRVLGASAARIIARKAGNDPRMALAISASQTAKAKHGEAHAGK
jgi:hypothetical protein